MLRKVKRMTFANQKSVLIHDKKGNIYNFYWNQGKIIFNLFNSEKQKYESKTIAEDSTLEFDSIIDNENNIYTVFQRKNGQIILMSRNKIEWNISELSKENQPEIINLNILSHGGKLHLIYCIPSNESEVAYKLYHHYLYDSEWKTLQIGDIMVRGLLNPFQVIYDSNRIILGFYNLCDNVDQIFMKEFDLDKNTWKNAIQLTTGYNDKLYLDMALLNSNAVHLTYSEYIEGNMVIKYEKYKKNDNRTIKVLDTVLSNPSNCSFPSFIHTKDNLWVAWTEHDQVVSCFSQDEGLTWSNPYLWKKSKEADFFRHKFVTNDNHIKSYYKLNHAFGKGYPEYSLMGFGPIEEGTEVPIKHKKKNEDSAMNDEHHPATRLNDTKTKVEDEPIQKKIEYDKTDIMNELKKLEERIEGIEQYLQRRRRGFFFRSGE